MLIKTCIVSVGEEEKSSCNCFISGGHARKLTLQNFLVTVQVGADSKTVGKYEKELFQ